MLNENPYGLLAFEAQSERVCFFGDITQRHDSRRFIFLSIKSSILYFDLSWRKDMSPRSDATNSVSPLRVLVNDLASIVS